MRCSHPEHAQRTFLCTTLFFVLSFTATLAESANVHGSRAHHAWRRRAPLDVIPRDQVPTLTTSLLPSIAGVLTSVLTTAATPTSVPSVVLPTPQSPSTPATPSLPSPPTNPLMTTSSSSSSTSPSTPTSTSATSTIVRTTSNGTPVSQSTSSQTSSSQSSSSSQTSSSAKPSTSTGFTAVVATTPAAQTLGLTSEYSGAGAVTGYATGTTTSSTPSSTSSSNSGFFSNTGAVAGTFTVAGLLGVAGVIGAGMMIARRRVSRSYEDDMEYLEKKPEPSVHSQSQNFVVGEAEESADSDQFDNSMEVTVPPAAHFYPQQDAYFAHGQAANSNEGYENQGYYPQEAYAPHEYGIAYPPTEPYAAEDPYGGIDEAYVGMPNPFDDAGSELPAALRPSGQRLLTVNPPPTAYRAPDLHHSIDSFYGSSTGASHGHAM